MSRLSRGLAAAVFAAYLLWAGPALAPYHVLVIEEIFFGSEAAPNAQYVMLRTLAIFQVFVDNQKITVQTADGTAAADFGEFDAITNVRTDAGVAILMGTPEAEALFGVTMDKVTSGRLVQPDGRICFGEFGGTSVDCVAYGAFTGTSTSGSPATAPVAGMALRRSADSNNDSADFQLAAPCPQNNAGAQGGSCPTPTPTSAPSATASPTATATMRPPPPLTDYVCPGDCNRDRTVMVNEAVLGVNIALDRAQVDTCLQADANRDGNVRVNELVSAVNSILESCPPLGTRRFSLNPDSSVFTAVLNLGPFANFGFTGYLDLRAGVPSPDGLAFIDIIDSSDFLYVPIPGQSGGADQVLCIKPRKDMFPIVNAGVIDCDGGTPFGFSSVQDHNIGMVGTCTAGENAGESCSGDGDCPDGECFTAADCTAARGTLEGSSDPHPGVCRGPLQATQIQEDSGVGGMFIGAGDPTGIFRGLPASFGNESALPCGDEGTPTETNFAFTTGLSQATIEDFGNSPDATFFHEVTGAGFSCRDFDQENSAGTLVLDVPTFDLEVPVLGTVDFISSFVLDD